MTMPHLMNCDHTGEGWCLACVKKLWEELEALRDKSDMGNPVSLTKTDHHLLCLGVLADVYRVSKTRYAFGDLPMEQKIAIEQAVESAEKLGLPVSLKRLLAHQPICTNIQN